MNKARHLLLLTGLLALPGCVVATTPVATPVAGTPALPYPPVPAAQAEAMPLPPVSEQPLTWRPGHWDWNGGAYIWVPGAWVPRAGHSTMWYDGHWAFINGGWVWQPAHWG